MHTSSETKLLKKPLFGELRSSWDSIESCIESWGPAMTDIEGGTSSLSSSLSATTGSWDCTIDIVDKSFADFALTSWVDKTCMETLEAPFVFRFLFL